MINRVVGPRVMRIEQDLSSGLPGSLAPGCPPIGQAARTDAGLEKIPL
jgi:hypothetical protein